MTQEPDEFYNWRRSIWSKGIALCFILQTILGNIWFAMAFQHLEAPPWLQILFSITLVALIFFALGLLVRQLLLKFGRRDDDEPSV